MCMRNMRYSMTLTQVADVTPLGLIYLTPNGKGKERRTLPGECRRYPLLVRSLPGTPTGLLLPVGLCQLDLNIHASRKVQLHQSINSLRVRLNNIEQTLISPDFKLLT